MHRIALFALIVLAACASGATHAPGAAAPTASELASALNVQASDVRNISCQAAEPGCHQCSYDVVHETAEGTGIEERVDMVCNVTGGWTATPMHQMGS